MSNRPVGGGSAFGGGPTFRGGSSPARRATGGGTRSDPFRDAPPAPERDASGATGRVAVGREGQIVDGGPATEFTREQARVAADTGQARPRGTPFLTTQSGFIPVSDSFASRFQELESRGEFERVARDEQERVDAEFARSTGLGGVTRADGSPAFVTPSGVEPARTGGASFPSGSRAVTPDGRPVGFVAAQTIDTVPSEEVSSFLRPATRRERGLERLRGARVGAMDFFGQPVPAFEREPFVRDGVVVQEGRAGRVGTRGTLFALDAPFRPRPESADRLRAQIDVSPSQPFRNVARGGGALVVEDPLRAATTVQAAAFGFGAFGGLAGGAGVLGFQAASRVGVRAAPRLTTAVTGGFGAGARSLTAAAAPSVVAGTVFAQPRAVGEATVLGPSFAAGFSRGVRSFIPRETVVGFSPITDPVTGTPASGVRGSGFPSVVTGAGVSDVARGGAVQSGLLRVRVDRGFLGSSTVDVPALSSASFFAAPTVAQTGFRVTSEGVVPRFGRPTSFSGERGFAAQLDRVTTATLPSGVPFVREQTLRGSFDPRTGVTLLSEGGRGGEVLAAVPGFRSEIARDAAGTGLFRQDLQFVSAREGLFGRVSDVRVGRSVAIQEDNVFRRGVFSRDAPRITSLDGGGVELGLGGFFRQPGRVVFSDVRFVSVSAPVSVSRAPSVSVSVPRGIRGRRAQASLPRVQSPLTVSRPELVSRPPSLGRSRISPDQIAGVPPVIRSSRRPPISVPAFAAGSTSLLGAAGALRSGALSDARSISGLRPGRLSSQASIVGSRSLPSLRTVTATQTIPALRTTTTNRTVTATRTVPGLRVPTGFTPAVARTPPPPRIPPVGLPQLPNFGVSGLQSVPGGRRGRREEFTPSLVANVLGLRGTPRRTTELTGLEIRPLRL